MVASKHRASGRGAWLLSVLFLTLSASAARLYVSACEWDMLALGSARPLRTHLFRHPLS